MKTYAGRVCDSSSTSSRQPLAPPAPARPRHHRVERHTVAQARRAPARDQVVGGIVDHEDRAREAAGLGEERGLAAGPVVELTEADLVRAAARRVEREP